VICTEPLSVEPNLFAAFELLPFVVNPVESTIIRWTLIREGGLSVPCFVVLWGNVVMIHVHHYLEWTALYDTLEFALALGAEQKL
jgi:hypothetical protein